MTELNNEWILSEEAERLNLFPIQHDDIWQFYKQSVASFWVSDEVSLSDDLADWERLDNDEKHFILMVLGFFACSDFIVNENLESNFKSQVCLPELKMFYNFQSSMEDIHSIMYQTLLDVLVKDNDTKQRLLHSTVEIPTIKAKADWAHKWIETGNWVQRLIAFAIVEGIFFSGSFCSIFWLKKRGLMRGLCISNEFISRDEGMHRDLACLVYSTYVEHKLPNHVLKKMIQEAVQVEQAFIRESLPYRLKGMNEKLMCEYIEYVADHLCVQLIGERIYCTENPFSWMVLISTSNKANFFESKPTVYAKTSLITAREQLEVRFDEEF
jgi:ribonucleoside-diphosphate reductase beta chain